MDTGELGTVGKAERALLLLINRNFAVAETILQKALDSNNLKAANEALKILNQMLGVGGKQVEIKDNDSEGQDRTITISFND